MMSCLLQVLAIMVEDFQTPQASPTSKSVPASVWQLISDALSAGAATLSTTAAAAASQPVCSLFRVIKLNLSGSYRINVCKMHR